MTEIKITITKQQWELIQELMRKHNITQDEAIEYILTVGIREKNFREENQ